MKTMTAKSFFKKARAGSANAGIKREDLVWSFEGVDASDIPNLSAEEVSRVLNGFIESFGRKLIANNADDWNFQVDPTICNFAAAYADLVEERKSGGRILTKESLAKFAELYVSVMVANDIPAKAAVTVASLIKEKFVSVAGKVDVIDAISNRIAQFCDFASEEELEPIAEVADAVVSLLNELSKPAEVTVDSI